MTAHLRSLNVLRENVHAELDRIMRYVTAVADDRAPQEAAARLRAQLEADMREVRADVDLIFDREGKPW